MQSSNVGPNLAFGLAAVGLGLVVAGVGAYRRRQAGRAAPVMAAAAGPEDGSPRQETDSPADRPATTAPTGGRADDQLLEFFVLVFALAAPFYLLGEDRLPIPVELPASALIFVNPAIAAAILTYRRRGARGVKELLKRAYDYRRIKNRLWLLPILFLNPLIYFVSYVIMRLAGRPLPEPEISLLTATVFSVVYFISGTAEQLGWQAFAYDSMEKRWTALNASLILGVIWGLYHLIPDIQGGRLADWILWQRVGGIALRVLLTWIYNNNGKSVFAATLFQDSSNLSWTLFPNDSSHYDPFPVAVLTGLVAIGVTIGWGPRTLARFRFASTRQMGAGIEGS